MKQTPIYTLITAILSGLLSLFGISCSEEHADMYGCPYAEFEIKGRVTDEKGESVNNVLITMKGSFKSANENEFFWITSYPELPDWEKHAIFTNIRGQYEYSTSTIPIDYVRIICTPAENSGLASDSIDVPVIYTVDKNKKDGWYFGAYRGEINFVLKPSLSK